MDDGADALQPYSRKPFELTPSTGSSRPATPAAEDDSSKEDASSAKESGDLSAESRSRSVFDLTSPALLGIFSPTALEGSTSPFGTGAQTPTSRANGAISQEDEPEVAPRKAAALRRTRGERPHAPRKRGFRGYVLPLFRRSVLLFVFGMACGVLITHLHDDPRVTPFTMEDMVDFESWRYMAFWGVVGVALGNLFPWFDGVWERSLEGNEVEQGVGRIDDLRSNQVAFGSPSGPESISLQSVTSDWSRMSRGIGAFGGVAFAIRKLPWESTLHVSLSLAVVNPFLWYILDRTKPGFVFSTIVGLTGMLALININPDIVPSPVSFPTPENDSLDHQGDVFQAGLSFESVTVAMWIASVLFCGCICFGSIGRRLAS